WIGPRCSLSISAPSSTNRRSRWSSGPSAGPWSADAVRLPDVETRLRDRVDARPVAISRVMQGVALMLVSLEQFVALSRIADGALAYPFFSWAPAPTITLAVAVLTLGWLTGFC